MRTPIILGMAVTAAVSLAFPVLAGRATDTAFLAENDAAMER